MERGKEVCGRTSGKNTGLESWCWLVEAEKAVKEKKDLSRFYENFDTKEGQKYTTELQLPGIGQHMI